jgi:superfamily II DNA or RNA helicase
MTTPITYDDIIEKSSLDQDQFDYLVKNVDAGWDHGSLNLIRTIQAPMSAGKTYTLSRATMPLTACNDSTVSIVMYVAPRNELVDPFLKKISELYEYQDLQCKDGTIKTMHVYDSSKIKDLLNDIELAAIRGKSAKQVIGNRVIFAAVSIQWLSGENVFSKIESTLPVDLVVIDEAHIGLQIGEYTRGIVNPDSGRYLPEEFVQTWKPMAEKLAKKGTKTLLMSATLSPSQLSETNGGKDTFYFLGSMPKREINQCFPSVHYETDAEKLQKNFESFFKKRIKKTQQLISAIDKDTWEAAQKINIVPLLGRALVKAGRKGATNGISLFDNNQKLHDELRNYVKTLSKPSIFTVTTSDFSKYEKISTVYFKEEFLERGKELPDVVEKLNDPINGMNPAVLAVIEMGTVGINILDIDTIVYLTIPNNPGEVTASQVQAMGRGNRFPFIGMRSHEQMRQLINSLNISLSQKYALAQYVVHKCETHIFAVKTGLMVSAYNDFSDSTMNSDQGLVYYMGHMTSASPAYVKPKINTSFPTTSYSMSYDASALNRLFKKKHCECCPVIDEKGTTTCEQQVRTQLEKDKGPIPDDVWGETWFGVLQLHHKDVNHNNYDLSNLITECPNMHMGITILDKHFNKRYN